jgi:hypothetical protein
MSLKRWPWRIFRRRRRFHLFRSHACEHFLFETEAWPDLGKLRKSSSTVLGWLKTEALWRDASNPVSLIVTG